jgi:hypothetical protein
VYAPAALHTLLDTASLSVLTLPVDWPAIKVSAIPRPVRPISAGSRHNCLRSLRHLGDSATLGTEAVRELAGDQSTSAVTDNQVRFPGKVIKLAFNYYVVLETALPSVLKLPVKWPATKVQALSRIIRSVSVGKPSSSPSITTFSWRQRYPLY